MADWPEILSGLPASWGRDSLVIVDRNEFTYEDEGWEWVEFSIMRTEVGCPSGSHVDYSEESSGSHRAAAQMSTDQDTDEWRHMLYRLAQRLKYGYNISHCLSKIKVTLIDGVPPENPVYLPCWLVTIYLNADDDWTRWARDVLLEIDRSIRSAYSSTSNRNKPWFFSFSLRLLYAAPARSVPADRPNQTIEVPAIAVYGESLGGLVEF
ncbi:hypothetical protein GGR57DRAFT_503143 [Xylariaceae sp. FL1272]|nr:hypothetical protein GGR57DRAFT_503143 [Xylariaceae sp. FL1272]